MVTGASVLSSPGNESSLAAKVFHLYVKDHVAEYLLKANRCRLPIKKNFESKMIVFHFFSNCVSPEGIAILFVKRKSFVDGPRNLDSKFMGSF